MLSLRAPVETVRDESHEGVEFDARSLLEPAGGRDSAEIGSRGYWPAERVQRARRIVEACLRTAPPTTSVRVQLVPTGDEEDFAVWVYERLAGRWVISATHMLHVILAFDRELGRSPVNPPSWVWNLNG